MKVSFIAPTSLIKEYGSQGDINLTLSHLIEKEDQNAYELRLRETALPIYLDNGLFENGVAEDIDVVLAKARELGAEYVFAPDIIYDRVATEESLIKTIARFKEKNIPNLKLAAIVQADNPEDFIASYKTLVEMDDVSLIGLSILSIPKSFASITGSDDISDNRLTCLVELSKLDKHKDSHLLGAGNHYRDVDFAAKHCPWIVSHDSSSAIWNGVQGKNIDPETLEVFEGKTKVHVDFNFDEELTDIQKERIQLNINVVKKVCHYDPNQS